MKQRKRVIVILFFSFILIILALLNTKFLFISVPSSKEMSDRQVDFITISTVFAGFSFSALGMLLGLSSEKLIEMIRNTSIITSKVSRIITSIIFFILSVMISMFFILGLNDSIFGNTSYLNNANCFIYVLGIGYLILGIIYFICSVYELYDLISKIYYFNNKNVSNQISKAKEEMKNCNKKLENVTYDKEE